MKIAIFAVASVMLVTGCATAQLDKGLRGLIGQTMETAIDHLGYPDGQRQVMGDTVYVWSTNHQAFLPMNTTTTTTGAVGGTPYYGTTNSMALVPVAAACTVQIATDNEGIIKRYQWFGNQMGCARYAHGF